MNIVALLFPIVFYGIYYSMLHLISATMILYDLWIGLFLGLYVVVMRQSKYRRLIALVHSVLIIALFCLKTNHNFLWLYQLGGLSIALTRRGEIQPLCPMPKTRMIIMTCIPLLWIVLVFIPNSAIGLAYMISGLLMGFYLWMKERLNDANRQLVTHITTGLLLLFSFFILKDYQYMWIVWVVFSQIIQIFRVKFI